MIRIALALLLVLAMPCAAEHRVNAVISGEAIASDVLMDGNDITGASTVETNQLILPPIAAPSADATRDKVFLHSSDNLLKVRKSTAGGGALVSLQAGGGGSSATFAEDEFIPTAAQTNFTLSTAYVGAGGLSVMGLNTVGGYAEGTHYTISGTTLIWLDSPFTLDSGDRLVIKFQTN